MARHRVIGRDDPLYPAIRRRLLWLSFKTVLGYLVMGALIALSLALFHVSISVIWGFGLIWAAMPLAGWWYSAEIAIAMAKATLADPTNPKHKRVIDIVHRLYAKSGLAFEPPVYSSPDQSPNAFATGPIHRKAVVAFTEGLLDIGLTDPEIEAVFAHELSHVKHYDVGINSVLAVLSTVLCLIVDAGVNTLLKGFKFVLPKSKHATFLPAIANSVIFYAVFWLVGQITRVIQLFVVRTRESAADAGAADMTGCPCALVSALKKLVHYVETHRPAPGREQSYWLGMRLMSTIDPLYDSLTPSDQPTGSWNKVKQWWRSLQETHPPIPDRVAVLEEINGGACPAVIW